MASSGARVIGVALIGLESLRRSHAAFVGQPGTDGRDAAGTVSGGGMALRHCALLAGGLLMLVGAGCQSDPVASRDPPAFDTGILSSNEANRLGRADLAAGNYETPSGISESPWRRIKTTYRPGSALQLPTTTSVASNSPTEPTTE